MPDRWSRKLVKCLPERDSIRNWVKVYCMSRDGASLATLLYKAMSNKKLTSFLIVIEDSWGYIFGGYVSTPFKNAAGYYGTGYGERQVDDSERRGRSMTPKSEGDASADTSDHLGCLMLFRVPCRECWVFKFHPEFTVFRWSGKNEFFLL